MAKMPEIFSKHYNDNGVLIINIYDFLLNPHSLNL